jgi:hypothetical protein
MKSVGILVATVVIVAIAMGSQQLISGAHHLDCASFRFDERRWDAGIRENETAPGESAPAEPRLLKMAYQLRTCGTLLGKTRRQVRGLLGRPNLVGDPQYGYILGPDALHLDSEMLWVTFAHGRVTQVESPDQ